MADEPTILKPTGFRDSIPTVDQAGKRLWVYPRQPPRGARAAKKPVNFYRLRTWVSYVLLAFLFISPFLRINGNPILMFNIVELKASIFGFMFWPEDFYLFAVTMVTALFMLIVFTAIFGRIWCGWLCPQTIMMEMVFRKIEYWLEGDSREQRELAKAPWTKKKVAKKALKQLIFFFMSFVIGNLLLAYIIGSEELLKIIFDPPSQHVKGLTAMVLFSLLFYAIFARFREQACTFVCPYGRVQSVLLDEQSIVVAYDWVRGDQRGPRIKDESPTERTERGLGDCIDCNMCVEVCPTGIDIRNGTQMECVNCTACIDSCNSVMEKIGLPPYLIKYGSLNGIAREEKMRFTPRLAIYSAILTALFALLITLFVARTPVEAQLLRTPGTWYQELPDGRISNLYNLRLINKSSNPMTLTLQLPDSSPATLQLVGGQLSVPPGEHGQSSVILFYPRAPLTQEKIAVEIFAMNDGEVVDRINTTFISPGVTQPKDSP